MIIQFFKGPKDGVTLEVPDNTLVYRAEKIPLDEQIKILRSSLSFKERSELVKPETALYYIESMPRPDGIYWAILEGVRVE